MTMIWVKAAPDRAVPVPHVRPQRLFSAEDAARADEADPYIQRRLLDEDLVVADPPKESPTRVEPAAEPDAHAEEGDH